MDPVVEIQETYPYPPELVWEAITDTSELGEWLMKTNFQPVVGFEFQFTYKPSPNWRGFVDCKVLSVDPPRFLSYTWDSDGTPPPSTVTWTLEPVPEGTKLLLRHRGFKGESGRLSYESVKPGWEGKLKTSLVASLERLSARKT